MSPTLSVIAPLLRVLDELSIPYAIGGSFASSAWGQPRQTMDVDVVVLLDWSGAERLARRLGDAYEFSLSEMQAAASGQDPFRSFQLLHLEDLFKIDVFVLSPGPYIDEMMARRRRYPIEAGFEAQFCSPEDIVIAKLRWFVLANRVSDRQWNDVVQVLETQSGSFDFQYARRWCGHFVVLAEFEAAAAQATLPN